MFSLCFNFQIRGEGRQWGSVVVVLECVVCPRAVFYWTVVSQHKVENAMHSLRKFKETSNAESQR